MKRLIFTTLFFLVSIINLMAQNPTGITQVEKNRESIWDSPERIIIVIAVIVGIVAARIISKKALKMRDEKREDKKN